MWARGGGGGQRTSSHLARWQTLPSSSTVAQQTSVSGGSRACTSAAVFCQDAEALGSGQAGGRGCCPTPGPTRPPPRRGA